MVEHPDKIWIVVADEVAAPSEELLGTRSGEDIGGAFGTRVASAIVRRVSVDTGELRRRMGEMLAVVERVFDHPRALHDLQLDEVQLSVEINAKGEVGILGTGGSVGGSGAIRLTFKRNANSAPAPAE